MNLQHPHMQRAIELSRLKMQAGAGGPFGAVIIRQGKVIAEGWNQVTSTNDPTAHAEIVAIRNASSTLKNFSLEGCELYSSCEPCPMCLAAAYWARIDKIYYAATRDDAAAIGFGDRHIYDELALPPAARSLPVEWLLRDDAVKVLEEWQKNPDRIVY